MEFATLKIESLKVTLRSDDLYEGFKLTESDLEFLRECLFDYSMERGEFESDLKLGDRPAIIQWSVVK